MKGYLSVQETADKWGVSIRWVNQYVRDGRIPGAERLGRAWAIPESAVKPEKRKSGSKQKSTIFAMITNERKKEFALLRLLGTSRRLLRAVIRTETAVCSLSGALAGITAAALLLFPFTKLIESSLGLPYLMPSVSMVLLTALAAAAGTVLAGVLASAWATGMLSQADPGTVLRGE